MQVVAQPFPPTGAVVRLSTTTGTAPVWLPTGEVVYATADQHFMSVAMTTTGGGRGNRFNVDSVAAFCSQSRATSRADGRSTSS
jgi:hypothetical protein